MRFHVLRVSLALSLGIAAVIGLSLAGVRPTPGLVWSDAHVEASAGVAASPSRTVETSLFSTSLGFEVPYVVYLPAGYDSSSDRSYPVLFMLHGLGGDRYMARVQGLFTAADTLINRGEIDPLIIIAPEGKKSYWVDAANSGPRWGSYITKDLVQEIDRLYRTVPDRDFRAIGGISMGGHGALQLAMNSDEFGVAGAHSVALRKFEEAFPMFGDRAYFEAHDPVSLCAKNRGHARSLKIWIDIGSEDTWFAAANAFHTQLTSAGIAHEWSVFPGAHNIEYWRAHAHDYLRFYDEALENPPPPP